MEPDHDVMRGILETACTIASVGLSTNPEKDSYQIDQYLQNQGYRIIPVNPMASEVLGEKAYPDIPSLPEIPDVVQVFRRPEDVPPVVDQAIAKGVKIIWFQEGTTHAESADKARAAGIEVVEDMCMRAAHRYFWPQGRKVK